MQEVMQQVAVQKRQLSEISRQGDYLSLCRNEFILITDLGDVSDLCFDS